MSIFSGQSKNYKPMMAEYKRLRNEIVASLNELNALYDAKSARLMVLCWRYTDSAQKAKRKRLILTDYDVDLRLLVKKGVITTSQRYDYLEGFAAWLLNKVNDELTEHSLRIEGSLNESSGDVSYYVRTTLYDVSNVSSSGAALLPKVIRKYNAPAGFLSPTSRDKHVASYAMADSFTDNSLLRMALTTSTLFDSPSMTLFKRLKSSITFDDLEAILEQSKSELAATASGKWDRMIDEIEEHVKLIDSVPTLVTKAMQASIASDWPNYLESKGIDYDEYL